jgi:crossover junction endodeoxyribonuclease RuvC
MRVLAIDPGYDRLGVAIMELADGREQLIASTCIETDRTTPLPERLAVLGEKLGELINTHAPTALAIETLFFNQNQKTAIAVAQARGVAVFLGQTAGCTVYEFGPQEIKVAVTGYGKSDKTAVTRMVRTLVPTVRVDARDDEYDAIAVGITCLAQHGRAV